MARQKTKKIRREIERLYQNGRYWEWLQRIQAEEIAGEYPRELDQAWKSLTRKALRLPAGLDEFHARVTDQLNPPKLPDFHFLMALKRLRDGDDSALSDLAAIKGLSPAAMILRSRVLRWDTAGCDWKLLTKLLKPFAEQPEKVTPRYYDELTVVVIPAGLDDVMDQLGEELVAFRRLNQRPMVKRGWSAISLTQLRRMDRAVTKVSAGLPEALRRLALLPFCVQVSTLLRRFAPERATADMAALVACFPGLFPRVAGDRAEELAARLVVVNAGGSNAIDPRDLMTRIEAASLEDNLVLLRPMRAALAKMVKAREENSFSRLFGFADDSDRDLMAQRHLFRSLYDKVIAQIAARAKDLPSRDSKELRRVLEPIIIDDLRFLVDDLGDTGELARLLQRLFHAGCAGKRLALLALLVARRERSKSLFAAAQQVLDQSPPVESSDLGWLSSEFEALYFPRLRGLAPLLERFQTNPSLLEVILENVHGLIEKLLVTAAVTEPNNPLAAMIGCGLPNMLADFRTVCQELQAMREYSSLDQMRVLVACFPTGRHTEKGFLKWLAHLHGHPEWPALLVSLVNTLFRRRLDADLDSFGSFNMGIMSDFLDRQIAALMGFINQHWDDFRTMDLGLIRELIQRFSADHSHIGDQRTLFIRLGNILEQRSHAGETEAATVQKLLLPLLKKPAEAQPKGRKSRRSRR